MYDMQHNLAALIYRNTVRTDLYVSSVTELFTISIDLELKLINDENDLVVAIS